MLMPDPVVLDKVLTKLFGDAFLAWEPETLEAELAKLKHETLSKYGNDEIVTNAINAIRVIKSEKSYALQEWHLFEKVLAALTGKRILFFDAQPPANLIEVFYGIEIIKKILDRDILNDLSEETLLYLGLILTDLGLPSFPFEPYNTAISLALKHLKLDESAKAVIADFDTKLHKFLSDKNAVVAMSELIEQQPDIDLLAEIKDISVFNAVTAVCGYILVRDDLNTNNLITALADDSLKPEEIKFDTKTNPEGIAPEIIDEIMSFIERPESDNLNKQAAKNTGKGRLPRSGMFIISPDADEFDPDHRYEGSGNNSPNSVISAQDSGESYHRPAPKSLKLIKDSDNISPQDKINAIFSGLDI